MKHASKRYPGPEARLEKGWWLANKWLILRRSSQLAILALFLIGPAYGLWVVRGNFASSLTLDLLPLTDLFLYLQTVAAGHGMETDVVIGAVIVAIFYLLVGGRVFCSWVCPMNLVTDAAAWLRARLGLKRELNLKRSTRYWVMAMVLILTALTGRLAWEWFNPVSMLHRGLIFGMGFAWLVVVGVFLFDLLLSKDGWCGRLCPMGAAYSLLSPAALVRVDAPLREACDDCMDCFLVCPEPQVISPALKGKGGHGITISEVNCTNCGRCIDVCSKHVFKFAFHLPDKTRVAL